MTVKSPILSSAAEIKIPQLSGRILIAEDMLVNQKVLSDMLEMLGYQFKVVSGGLEVLNSLRHESFDLILMDGKMPGLDGYATTQKIRQGQAGEQNRQIPVLEVSASFARTPIEKFLQYGMNDCIAKPISLEDLADKLQLWLSRGSQVIDFVAIKRLHQVSRGEELVRELGVLFFEDTPKILKQLEQLNQPKAGEEFIRLAHGLKSTCATLGAFRMKDLAVALEKVNLSSREERAHLIVQLQQEYIFFQSQFSQRLAG